LAANKARLLEREWRGVRGGHCSFGPREEDDDEEEEDGAREFEITPPLSAAAIAVIKFTPQQKTSLLELDVGAEEKMLKSDPSKVTKTSKARLESLLRKKSKLLFSVCIF